MFYSETLLSKTGPLARVWLSANIEKKLSKGQILQSDIGNSVNAIVDQGGAPMALRLTGQLLLGVVRIYSRKARYLLDDCNEALAKIKMAFRPGKASGIDDTTLFNQDASSIPNPGLNLADALADVFTSIPTTLVLDDSFLNLGNRDLDIGIADLDPLNWTSQVFPGSSLSIEHGRGEDGEEPLMYEDDLDLDTMEPEIGRNAAGERSIGDDLRSEDDKFHENDLGLDVGEDEPLPARQSSEAPMEQDAATGVLPTTEDPMNLDDQDNFDEPFALPLDDLPTLNPIEDPRLERDSQSPLSSARSSIVREFDATMLSSPEATLIQARQPASKKRKLIALDTETMLRQSELKQQQNDRSAILKPLSLLPHDSGLLALMQMQKNGSFVTDIMGGGRAKNWAPELRGLMTIDVIRRSGALKRKRDSGVADISSDEDHPLTPTDKEQSMPRIEIPEDDDDLGMPHHDEGIALQDDPSIMNIPAAPSSPSAARTPRAKPTPSRALSSDDDENEDLTPPPLDDEDIDNPNAFDDTTAPLIPLASQGPISLGTRHAVHLLREHFGAEPPAGQSQAQQAKKSVLFQDLLPEQRTSKSDATKMFFEVLVLATKDAIKVEQPRGKDTLGAPIRVRAKRGLWGEWAEVGVEGSQDDEDGEKGEGEGVTA